MRILAFIEFTAVAIGIAGMIAGQFFAIPKGLHLGVFMVGAGIALGGLESVVTRRMWLCARDNDVYAGVPAVIVGLIALLIGAGFIGAAYVLDQGMWNSTVHYLTRRPALLLMAGGLLLIGVGLLMMLNPRGRSGVAWTLLVRVPRSLAGFLLVVAGLAGIGLSVWEWLEPYAFDRFVRNLRPLNWRAFERWWNSLPALRG